ncbi:hypothetical protein ACKKBG_A20020 [Auxenochlorella protothecoides x Auxenochlorella symbiontica]
MHAGHPHYDEPLSMGPDAVDQQTLCKGSFTWAAALTADYDRPGDERQIHRRWTMEEQMTFFRVLRESIGQKPETLCIKLARQIEHKQYNQVRDYYYRLTRRLRAVLDPSLDLNSATQVQLHWAMLRLWDTAQDFDIRDMNMTKLCKTPKRMREFSKIVSQKVASILKSRQVSYSPHEGHLQEQTIDTPVTERAADQVARDPLRGAAANFPSVQRSSAPTGSVLGPSDRVNQLPLPRARKVDAIHTQRPHQGFRQPVDRKAVRTRFRVQFHPMYQSTLMQMEASGTNPYLEICCGPKKTIYSILLHLSSKWNEVRTSENADIYISAARNDNGAGAEEWSLYNVSREAKMCDITHECGEAHIVQFLYRWGSKTAGQGGSVDQRITDSYDSEAVDEAQPVVEAATTPRETEESIEGVEAGSSSPPTTSLHKNGEDNGGNRLMQEDILHAGNHLSAEQPLGPFPVSGPSQYAHGVTPRPLSLSAVPPLTIDGLTLGFESLLGPINPSWLENLHSNQPLLPLGDRPFADLFKGTS